MVIILKPAKGGGRRPHTYASSLAYYMRTAKANELGLEYGIALANYINSRDAGPEPAEPRVVATGGLVDGQSVSFAGGEIEVQRRLSIRSSRSRKPIRHSVGSQREQPCPTPEECDERTRILAEELGCERGALLWALHGDTDHWHIHWLICTLDEKVQPTTFGPGGRSHDAMQRAIARIDHAHGLTPESGATYVVVGGEVRPKSRSEVGVQPRRRAPIKAEVLRWEKAPALSRSRDMPETCSHRRWTGPAAGTKLRRHSHPWAPRSGRKDRAVASARRTALMRSGCRKSIGT